MPLYMITRTARDYPLGLRRSCHVPAFSILNKANDLGLRPSEDGSRSVYLIARIIWLDSVAVLSCPQLAWHLATP